MSLLGLCNFFNSTAQILNTAHTWLSGDDNLPSILSLFFAKKCGLNEKYVGAFARGPDTGNYMGSPGLLSLEHCSPWVVFRLIGRTMPQLCHDSVVNFAALAVTLPFKTCLFNCYQSHVIVVCAIPLLIQLFKKKLYLVHRNVTRPFFLRHQRCRLNVSPLQREWVHSVFSVVPYILDTLCSVEYSVGAWFENEIKKLE